MASSMSPLVCMMCQDRSERPVDANIDACTCVTGYEMKSSDCLGKINNDMYVHPVNASKVAFDEHPHIHVHDSSKLSLRLGKLNSQFIVTAAWIFRFQIQYSKYTVSWTPPP